MKNRFSLPSLHTRLTLVILLIITPALLLILYIGFEQREDAAAQITEEALRTTHIIAEYQEQMVLRSHQLILMLAEIEAVQKQQSQACREMFARIVKQYSSYTGFAAATPNGKIFCSSSPNFFLAQMDDVSHMDWFKRSIDIRDFAVSDMVLDPTNDQSSQTFGYPVYDSKKNLRAVLLVALDVNVLNHFANSVNLPEGSNITMFDNKGTILGRYPEQDDWVGKTMPDHPMIKTIISRQEEVEGTAELPGLDNVPRLYAFNYRRYSEQGLYLTVGIPADAAFGEANQKLTRNLILLGMIALVEIIAAIIGGNIFILRPVRLLVQATKQFSSGDMSTRIALSQSVDELNQLATSFNDMAGILQSHEISLRNAETRYRSLVEHIPAVIYTINLTTNTMEYMSPRIVSLLGNESASGKDIAKMWQTIIHPDDQQRVKKAIDERREHEQPLRIEYRLQAENGSTIWVRDEGIVTVNEQQQRILQGTLIDITQQKEAEELVNEQAEIVRMLTTPLLQIGDKMVLMPLVGDLDNQRVSQMMHTLLEGVEKHRTKVVILDITGVPVVDTQVANALVQTERAIRLLGARVVLTGIRPEVAQALVGLGIDLTTIATRSTLQDGIAYALRKTTNNTN